MAKTLLIKLAETIDNDNLPYLGELRYSFVSKSSGVHPVKTISTETTYAEIIGGDSTAHFTDSTGAQNLGKSATIAANSDTTLYLSNNAVSVRMWPKYKLISFIINGVNARYLYMDLNQFLGCTELHALYLSSESYDKLGHVTGDIAALKYCTKLGGLGLACQFGIYGDISALSGMTQLGEFFAFSTNLSGDISAFLPMTKLSTANIGTSQMTGDTSSIASLHPDNGGKLSKFSYPKTSITGTWPPSA